MGRKIGWVDGKDNIAIVRYNSTGEIIPIEGIAMANNLKINGGLYVLSPINGSLYAKNAEIGGPLEMEKAKITGMVYIPNAKIGESLYARDAEIDALVDADNIKISEGLIIANAKIGSLHMENAKIDEGVNAEGAKINGHMIYKNAEVNGEMNVKNAKIRGWLDISDAKIPELITSRNTKFEGINLAGTEIEKFKGELPKINDLLYAINENTELPDSLTKQLPHYEEVYKGALRV